MLSKENQLKVAGLSAVLATTLGLGGALVAPATALAEPSAQDKYEHGYINKKDTATAEGQLELTTENGTTDRKDDGHTKDVPTLIDVVRLYNPWTGEHLFSVDQKEVSDCEKAGWQNEGTFWKAYSHVGDWQAKFGGKDKKCGATVYRLYNPWTGEHLYTTSSEEYNKLKTTGWNGEGIAFYSVNVKKDNTAQVAENDVINTTPQGVYRAFNKNVTVGTHNFAGYEENATMLANGWLPDNVVDGVQKPIFMVYDLDHTVNEGKIAQSLARITKEYKVNLEKYKALKKELVDALLTAKYSQKTELDNLKKVADVTKSLNTQLADTLQYLNKLKYQAELIINDMDGKYGKDGSEAKSKAYEVLHEKDNYVQYKTSTYDPAVTALNNAKVALATAKGDLLKEQGVLLGLKADLDAKTALYNEAKSAYDHAADTAKDAAKQKMDAADNAVKEAQAKIDGKENQKGQQSKVDDAQKAVDDQQKVVDEKAAAVKDAAEQLKAYKNLFNENVKKFQDYRHSQDLKKSQALRDVEVFTKYALVYNDLASDLKTLSEKEDALKVMLEKTDATSLVGIYNKAITDALDQAKKDAKVPDLSKLKATLESALDEYFLRLVPGVDEFNF